MPPAPPDPPPLCLVGSRELWAPPSPSPLRVSENQERREKKQGLSVTERRRRRRNGRRKVTGRGRAGAEATAGVAHAFLAGRFKNKHTAVGSSRLLCYVLLTVPVDALVSLFSPAAQLACVAPGNWSRKPREYFWYRKHFGALGGGGGGSVVSWATCRREHTLHFHCIKMLQQVSKRRELRAKENKSQMLQYEEGGRNALAFSLRCPEKGDVD